MDVKMMMIMMILETPVYFIINSSLFFYLHLFRHTAYLSNEQKKYIIPCSRSSNIEYILTKVQIQNIFFQMPRPVTPICYREKGSNSLSNCFL